MEFKAENHGDYLNFNCGKCNGDIAVAFLGYDPAVPRFKFTCKSCGQSGEYKMQFQLWSGLPQKPHKP
jgi:transcription elongation factor Elf1